jgi:trimeric autotransporter adhesin
MIILNSKDTIGVYYNGTSIAEVWYGSNYIWPAKSKYTYTLMLEAYSSSYIPTITMEGNSVTPTYSNGYYTVEYSSSNSSVAYTISDGLPSDYWGSYNVSAYVDDNPMTSSTTTLHVSAT